MCVRVRMVYMKAQSEDVVCESEDGVCGRGMV